MQWFTIPSSTVTVPSTYLYILWLYCQRCYAKKSIEDQRNFCSNTFLNHLKCSPTQCGGCEQSAPQPLSGQTGSFFPFEKCMPDQEISARSVSFCLPIWVIVNKTSRTEMLIRQIKCMMNFLFGLDWKYRPVFDFPFRKFLC